MPDWLEFDWFLVLLLSSSSSSARRMKIGNGQLMVAMLACGWGRHGDIVENSCCYSLCQRIREGHRPRLELWEPEKGRE